jgi:REP element-mobilizing transposase RayT/predicted transcriptional regulator
MVGYYHIVNRGVEKRIVYHDDDDFKMFLEILCSACMLYDARLHAYVLMRNHYHLLIETKQENLSKFMKHINASYAIYFNRKNKRSGHLWQGRFKSWYVTDEAYLYTLVHYIHNNPLKAKIAKNLKEYPYSSYPAFIEMAQTIPCLQSSFIFQDFKEKNERKSFLQSTADERILTEIKKASSLVVTSASQKVLSKQRLESILSKITDTEDRNTKILQAYNKGYSQHAIPQYIGISQPYINRIIKKIRES